MNKTLLRVKRGEGCDCDLVWLYAADGASMEYGDHGDSFPCVHASEVEVLPLRVMECTRCVGTGTIKRGPVAVARGWDAEVTCSDCLGTGLRLAEIGDREGERER